MFGRHQVWRKEWRPIITNTRVGQITMFQERKTLIGLIIWTDNKMIGYEKSVEGSLD
jgi:hypothetical protein